MTVESPKSYQVSQSPRSSDSPAGTGSRTTGILGVIALIGIAVLAVLGWVLTEPDAVQGDAMRLIYVHVPSAVVSYLGLGLTAVGSIMVLLRGSRWWDIAAAAGAEIGVLFTGLTLATGVIWGRPIWNTWWEWGDVRIMTYLMLFLVGIGYLAYRRTISDVEVRARRSAVIGIVGGINIPIVRQSVEWWASRTLHQQSTLAEGKMEDLTLFSLMFGFVVFGVIFAWMIIHRFRIGWLEYQLETVGLEQSLRERREQAGDGVDAAIAHPGIKEQLQ